MEILLETFVLFSCLMFWVVFFHKRGTLAKLKKMESSIKAKIHILEDVIDRQIKNIEKNTENEINATVQSVTSADMVTAAPTSVFPTEPPETQMTPVAGGAAPSFEQQIENMLQHHAVANESEEEEDPIEVALADLIRRNQAHESYRQEEKIAVPRTQPIESFEDVIKLSKAIEKQKTSGAR